jgi:hypothetical protein
METTLTINIPPPERVRAAKGEKLKKEKNEAVQGSPNKGREKDREEEKVKREKEKDEERERRRKEEKDKDLREREKLERERRVSSSPWSFSETVHSKNQPQALAERGISYKEKCVTITVFHLVIPNFCLLGFRK